MRIIFLEMMNRKGINMLSSIVFFKECIKQINKSSSSIQNFYISKGVCESAIKALEKQQPKKIMYREQNYGTPYLCPECEADQVKVEFFNENKAKEQYSFCCNCGQKLDWDYK